MIQNILVMMRFRGRQIVWFLLLDLFLSKCLTVGGNYYRGLSNSCPSFTSNSNFNQWSSPASCGNVPSIPEARYGHSAAVYTRGCLNDSHTDNMPRMVIFGGRNCNSGLLGDTWLYYPMINSWIRPQLNIEPPPRSGYSMTTVCETRVLVLGGSASDDLWMFDGVTETWSQIKLSSNLQITLLLPRYTLAAAIHQHNSSCMCKESVLVYGVFVSSSEYVDNQETNRKLWELRCIDDFQFVPTLLYEWISLGTAERGQGIHSPVSVRPFFSFGGSSVFAWEGFGLGLWRFDIGSNEWISITNDTHFNNRSRSCPVTPSAVLPYRIAQQNAAIVLYGNRQYILNLTTGEMADPFSHESTPELVASLARFSAVAMGEVVLVYGGNSFTYGINKRVWNLTVSNNRWHWTFQHRSRHNTPCQALYAK